MNSIVTASSLIRILSALPVFLCGVRGQDAIPSTKPTGFGPGMIESLKRIGSTEGFKPYDGNPILKASPAGSFDAGALGSACVLRVGDVFHLYYEAWGVRTTRKWIAAEYETLQIGHATSTDGIHWKKDPNNPVLPRGGKGDFDRTGVWDPYVIHEDGQFKMWYGREKPNALRLVTSATSTGFDFNSPKILTVAGDDSRMCKFGHVLRDDDGWHLFYSNYDDGHGQNSIVRYAHSDDGIRWQVKNKAILKGLDADVLRVADDLYLMVYAPQGGFDANGTDIRLAVYNGRLPDLASKKPLDSEEKPR